MRRQLRMAALAGSLVMALGTFALAQDRDDYYYRGDVAQTRQYGYDNGFRDGEKRGRHERSEEHTSELQSRVDLVCRLLLEKKKRKKARTSARQRCNTTDNRDTTDIKQLHSRDSIVQQYNIATKTHRTT